jgi:MarR-like DNA-binding transcriptional regulator SgrR of sgrS sRNA
VTRAIAVGILVLVAAGGATRAETRPAYGGGGRAAATVAPVRLDPLSMARGDQELAPLVWEAPFRVDRAGAPRPLLVAGVDAAQPLRPRLLLKRELRTCDGKALRAADVAASLTRALGDPGGWALGPIRAARAISDDVVELELARPAPDLALLLSTPAAMVTAANGGARRGGTGPFHVTAAGTRELRLASCAAPAAGRPFLDGITIRVLDESEEAQAFEAGSLDLSRPPPSALAPGARRPAMLIESPMVRTGLLAVGRGVEPAVARALAAALAHRVDRARLRRALRAPARPAFALAPPALGGPDPQAAPPARAEDVELLRARRPKLRLLVERQSDEERAAAERLLVEAERLGVELTLEPLDAPAFEERRARGDYDLLLTTVIPPAPDAGLAELAALAVVDPAGARRLLARGPAQAGITAGAPGAELLVPLWHRAVRLAVTPELRELALDPVGRPTWADAHWRRR